VFASDRDGFPEIYSMAADGRDIVRLTDDSGTDTNPDWSPDGLRIAFASDRDGDLEIFLMAADGSNVQQVTHNGLADSSVDWSPDGQRLLVDADGDDGVLQVFVMALDGSGRTQLTRGDPSGKPVWSPDGGRIAFMKVLGDNQEIFVTSADGTDQLNLTNHPARDLLPAWSPDGQSIAFVSDRDGNWEIYLMRPDGGGCVASRTIQARTATPPGRRTGLRSCSPRGPTARRRKSSRWTRMAPTAAT
jgi:Tol biopolymer transport system component